MLQSHPIEEPHLDFSSWREHFNNNSNNNDAPSSSRHALDLPTSWTQTFDQSLLRLDNVSNNRFSLIDRVMNDNNTQRSIPQQSILSQPELLPPQLPPFDNNFQQTSSSSSSSSHNSEEQNDQDIESVWEQSSQQQDINTLKPLTWDDHIQPTPFLTELPLLVSEQLFQKYIYSKETIIYEEK
ncbi:hypothetical protein BDA99DRAFT_166476 [Phascolomyces articulosus]|uniref:Uncharacterized protein n=1 Tax=Phascolomyces articulosus TaxID=60185 RepID=A0AAD5K764_9FUNG|nr:hypothetical protein BDA99DRAFT_166476 [Phascolomyces articulosus]